MTTYAARAPALWSAARLRAAADALDAVTDAQCEGRQGERAVMHVASLTTQLLDAIHELTGQKVKP